MVTFALGTVLRTTVNVAVPPASVVTSPDVGVTRTAGVYRLVTIQPMSFSAEKSRSVKSFRSPVARDGSIAASVPPLCVPSAQWPWSGASGTGPPKLATEAGPLKKSPATNRAHGGDVPKPRTCPSSCTATDRKSFWPGPIPAALAPKYQLVPAVSKLMLATDGA